MEVVFAGSLEVRRRQQTVRVFGPFSLFKVLETNAALFSSHSTLLYFPRVAVDIGEETRGKEKGSPQPPLAEEKGQEKGAFKGKEEQKVPVGL